jgi:hypothetical protein
MLPSRIQAVAVEIASTMSTPPARIAIPLTIQVQPAQNVTTAIILAVGIERIEIPTCFAGRN